MDDLTDIILTQLADPFRIGLLVALLFLAANGKVVLDRRLPIALALIFIAGLAAHPVPLRAAEGAQTADPSARLLRLLKFQAYFPDYSLAEISTLTDREISVEPFDFTPAEYAHSRTSEYLGQEIDPSRLHPQYVAFGAIPQMDNSIAPPRIEITSGVKPRISIDKSFDDRGAEAYYYFEIDTDPDFTSPNLWRYPALLNTPDKPDLPTREGFRLNLLQTTQRDWSGRENVITFPFRASAMRLPGWDRLNFDEMQKQARALAFGLSDAETIREVFAYMRQTYPWANDTRRSSPLDTFLRGQGECGHVTQLAGTFLEMNGIRFRKVQGFNPFVRQLFPGGGHSAGEVFDADSQQWSYYDPYLDLLFLDVSAQEIAYSTKYDKTFVYSLHDKVPQLGQALSLRGLFRYRYYSDPLGRSLAAFMGQVFGREAEYGMSWKLEEAPDYTPEELFAERPKRIYVRARYMFSNLPPRYYSEYDRPLEATPVVRVSPWAVSSFDVDPIQGLN